MWVRFTGFGTIGYMAVRSRSCLQGNMGPCETEHVTNDTCSCAARLYSSLHPPFVLLSALSFLSPLPFAHYWRLTGLSISYGTPSLEFLRPGWQLVISILTGASSAIAPPVGTYAQALFVALFRDAPVACTGNGAERSWCSSSGGHPVRVGLRVAPLPHALPRVGNAG